MNTNIITQLAKVIGPETKESFAVIKKDRGALHSIKMGLATAVLFASGGMATAQQPYAAGANQYYGLYAPSGDDLWSLLERRVQQLAEAGLCILYLPCGHGIPPILNKRTN